jgi:type II secretory pathway pseudopilin PulG
LLKRLKTISHKRKLGNTLSETLIALVVIGIVFTLSIGTFVADYNKNQTVVRLKKVYGVLSQAFDNSAAKNGYVADWDFPNKVSTEGSYLFFDNYLKKYLFILRDCKSSTEGNCAYIFKDLTGKEQELSSNWTRFYLNDGMFLAMQCNATKDYKVIYFYIDTNGKKRLNVVGRDIFIYEYWLENNKHPEYVGRLLPYGSEYTREELISNSDENNCNNASNGNYCAALIMKDNWQIIKGYPWAHARYVVQ